jgi:FkbM family methyltransferase
MAFYSQYGEDRWITENLLLPTVGVFVEVGGEDGAIRSNTLHFEQKGWTGLIIEPDPRQRENLARNRRCLIENCAIGVDPHAVFHLTDPPALSGFLREGGDLRVPVKTLGNVLRENGIGMIDLLSIDTEGTEIEIWRSFEPEFHRPDLVIIEYNTQGLPLKDNELLDEMNRGPYRLLHRTEANLIFRRLPSG